MPQIAAASATSRSAARVDPAGRRGGRGTKRIPSTWPSSSAARSCSRKSGFPSATARMRARSGRPVSAGARPSSSARSPAGERVEQDGRGVDLLPPQPGRASRRSGRARQTMRMGPAGRARPDARRGRGTPMPPSGRLQDEHHGRGRRNVSTRRRIGPGRLLDRADVRPAPTAAATRAATTYSRARSASRPPRGRRRGRGRRSRSPRRGAVRTSLVSRPGEQRPTTHVASPSSAATRSSASRVCRCRERRRR